MKTFREIREGSGKPESWEAGYKRRVVRTTKPEHKEKGMNWRIKGKDRPEISIRLYKENILFLGDSISLGLGVDGHKIFPSIVSSKLNYNGFNFSINGYSTDQLYIILDI